MNDIEKINRELQKEFVEKKDYYTLERYVMSELLSPIQDYPNAIKIIKENDTLCEGLNLYYVASYLCSEWLPGKNEFLEKLDDMIDMAAEGDKAIIYYLKAHDISCTEKNWRESEEYRSNLLKSIEYSKDINFVNNRYYFAKILDAEEAQDYLKEAAINVKKVETEETINDKSIDYRLSSQSFIAEFILGTELTQEVYNYKFREKNMNLEFIYFDVNIAEDLMEAFRLYGSKNRYEQKKHGSEK